MNSRERFLLTCKFEAVDRVFLHPQWTWGITIKRWQNEGMPKDVYFRTYFGFDRLEMIPINLSIIPQFEEETIEETGSHRIIRCSDGSIRKVLKIDRETSMDQWLEYPVKDRKSWEEYKKRLDPHSPIRYPENWEDFKKIYKDRDFPLGIHIGSYYGWPRNWIGVENLSYLFYDDPNLVHEICDYIAYFIIEVIKRALEEVEIDFAHIWEDMAYKTGPLCSPAQFKEFMLPCYKKVIDFVRSYGIEIISLDSDGNVEELIPLWLDAGVNFIYPLEVAANMDPIKLRKKYGKNLILMGGIDKRALASTPNEIEKEVNSKVPFLLEEGGYFPMVDHSVPHDVSFSNFVYYLNLIKKIGRYY